MRLLTESQMSQLGHGRKEGSTQELDDLCSIDLIECCFSAFSYDAS